MRLAIGFVFNQELSRVVFTPPFICIILMDFVLRSTRKAIGDHGIKWGGRTLFDLEYADDLGILDESESKMNEFLEVLRVQGAIISLKINVKKTKSFRLGISEDEKVTLGNKKIDQVGSFTYHDGIISKDGGSSEDAKSRIAKAQGVFSQLNKVWKNRKTSLQTTTRILEATVITRSSSSGVGGSHKERFKGSAELAGRL